MSAEFAALVLALIDNSPAKLVTLGGVTFKRAGDGDLIHDNEPWDNDAIFQDLETKVTELAEEEPFE